MNQRARNLIITGIIGLLIITIAVLVLSEPNNADECMLKNIKNAKSDAAAQVVAMSCRNLYSEK